MGRVWFAVVFAASACGHSTTQPQPVSSQPLSAQSRSSEPVPVASGDDPGVSTKGEPVGDEPRKQPPIDAPVRALAPTTSGMDFAIVLPQAVGPGVVTQDWTGVFTADHKELSDTTFKLVLVDGWAVRAHIDKDKLPSQSVRLFPPGYTH